MEIKDREQLFLTLLSNVRKGAERSSEIYHKLSDVAERPEVKEALTARAFVSEKVLGTIDECFTLLNKKPVETSGQFEEGWFEDFRNKLSEIKTPELRHLFIMSKAHQFNQFRMGEYVVLIEMANAMGHYGVSLLLGTCLADKEAFMARTRHLLRAVIEGRIEQRMAA